MLKYDSVHGRFEGEGDSQRSGNEISLNGNAVQNVTAERDPAKFTMGMTQMMQIYVIESTGFFRTEEISRKTPRSRG